MKLSLEPYFTLLESICSRSGGRDYGTPGMVQFTTNFDPGYDIQGVTPPVNDVETRYYFDVTTRRCTSFSYGRYGGNFNNFLSAADCEAYCGNQGRQMSWTYCDSRQGFVVLQGLRVVAEGYPWLMQVGMLKDAVVS